MFRLLQHSFTIGISDTIADEATMKSINKTMDAAKAKAHELLNQLHSGIKKFHNFSL
jgi:hypothetical protein